ncbi:hypothetical protein EMIT07CA2_80243 [Brevibacillus sp. IT-7CA2]
MSKIIGEKLSNEGTRKQRLGIMRKIGLNQNGPSSRISGSVIGMFVVR